MGIGSCMKCQIRSSLNRAVLWEGIWKCERYSIECHDIKFYSSLRIDDYLCVVTWLPATILHPQHVISRPYLCFSAYSRRLQLISRRVYLVLRHNHATA